MLSKLNLHKVKEHYDKRRVVSSALQKRLQQSDITGYSDLALGISDPAGNYSAAEHGLGPQILNLTTPLGISRLASKLVACPNPRSVPKLIEDERLPYVKISVGTEMALMLRPNDCWVANVRTVWAHLLIQSGDSYDEANEQLSLYRDSERSSEMNYKIWSDIHALLEAQLKRLDALGRTEAERQGVTPGKARFLWADAIANELYACRDLG